jgi:hypothetical protein
MRLNTTMGDIEHQTHDSSSGYWKWVCLTIEDFNRIANHNRERIMEMLHGAYKQLDMIFLVCLTMVRILPNLWQIQLENDDYINYIY